MAERKVQDLPINLEQLATDLDLGPRPSGGGSPTPEQLASMPDALAQLQAMVMTLSKLGAVERRADGSFQVAGAVDPRAGQIEAQGSDCTCHLCSPHNQRHWFCAGPGCYSGPHEWVVDQPRAEPRYVLGEAGKSGRAYQFCHPQCRVNFHNAQWAQQRVAVPNEVDAIPLAP